MISIRIVGTGEYRPQCCVTSAELDRVHQKRTNWTEERVGVATRRYAGASETSSFMGAQAATEALAAAGVDAGEVDCVVSACAVMEQPIPCLAAQIQRTLGLGDSGIPAFDVNATCLSFVVALDMMACAIAVGRYRRVLIVSSEIASAGLDAGNPYTGSLFGDGAAAVVIEATAPGSSSALLATHLATFGAGADLCQLRAGGTKMRPHQDLPAFMAGTYFEMDGKATYRMVAERFPEFFATLLRKAAVNVADLQCIIPHQASGQALDHVTALLGLPPDRVVRVIADHGNQIAASLPVALHCAIRDGRLRRGDLALILGSGAGLSMGGTILRY